MKASVGLNRSRLVNLAVVLHEVACCPRAKPLRQKVADRAVTLVADENKLIPLKTTVKANDTTRQAPLPVEIIEPGGHGLHRMHSAAAGRRRSCR